MNWATLVCVKYYLDQAGHRTSQITLEVHNMIFFPVCSFIRAVRSRTIIFLNMYLKNKLLTKAVKL